MANRISIPDTNNLIPAVFRSTQKLITNILYENIRIHSRSPYMQRIISGALQMDVGEEGQFQTLPHISYCNHDALSDHSAYGSSIVSI